MQRSEGGGGHPLFFCVLRSFPFRKKLLKKIMKFILIGLSAPPAAINPTRGLFLGVFPGASRDLKGEILKK
jgi:hypothetical protein